MEANEILTNEAVETTVEEVFVEPGMSFGMKATLITTGVGLLTYGVYKAYKHFKNKKASEEVVVEVEVSDEENASEED